MNIFVLDQDIPKCAEYHADQHVNKMILESTQMLCTVLNQLGLQTPYRSTHMKHPCTLWTGKSLSNWIWLRSLAQALNVESKFRFDRQNDHRSILVLRELPEPPIEDIGLTSFAQAMPEKYQVPGDAVQAYRSLYIEDKSRFAVWTKREPPAWYLHGIHIRSQK
jgi:hypothetical protein